MTANVRNFKKSDIPALLDLIKATVDYHRKLDEYYKPYEQYRNLEEEMESWLADKDAFVLVAEKDGKLAGYLQVAAELPPAYVSAKKIGVIYNLFVIEKERRRGLARRFMERGFEWFKTKKIKSIELSVDARNKAGLAFWKKLGFFEYKLRMRLDL